MSDAQQADIKGAGKNGEGRLSSLSMIVPGFIGSETVKTKSTPLILHVPSLSAGAQGSLHFVHTSHVVIFASQQFELDEERKSWGVIIE